ncbi:proline dehydrogenase family protein, partial [bacterium]|nr:proline dehydrogenase family protein [bacterium]
MQTEEIKEHKTMNTPHESSLESRILEVGEELLSESQEESSSIFNKDWWYGKIMDWSMKNDQFKTQMFRFVDVLPNLESSTEVVKHMKEYFSEFEGNASIKSLFSFSTGIGSVAPGIVSSAIKKNVKQMAKMFITGATPEEALVKIEESRNKNITFTADLLGEATLSEPEAKEYLDRYLELIEKMSLKADSWQSIAQIDADAHGDIPKVNISVKLTSLYSQIKIEDWDNTKEILKDKLRTIFTAAIEKNVFVNVDMESYKYKDLTLEVFKELLDEIQYNNYPHFGIVIQAYLLDSKKDLEELIAWSNKRTSPISVRLVKGAYWDYEVIHAKQQNWPIPVYTDKAKTDANYEDCCKMILEAKNIKLALASHNARSIAYCMSLAERLNIPKNDFEIQMLFGMAHSIKSNVIAKGYRIREYATIGDLIPGMAYLVRRLLENTSNESFLRSKDVEQKDV